MAARATQGGSSGNDGPRGFRIPSAGASQNTFARPLKPWCGRGGSDPPRGTPNGFSYQLRLSPPLLRAVALRRVRGLDYPFTLPHQTGMTSPPFRSVFLLEHDLFRKPVPTPDQARGRLFRDHAPTGFRCCPSSLYTFPLPGLARDCRREVSPSLGSSASAVSRGALKSFKSVASAIPPRPRGAPSYTHAAGSRRGC